MVQFLVAHQHVMTYSLKSADIRYFPRTQCICWLNSVY